MKVEVLAIGDELLWGSTVNTNTSYISAKLMELGLTVGRQTVLPDDSDLLLEGFKELVQRSGLVIATGGLGPTGDDTSRRVLAQLFDSECVYHPDLASHLEQRYGKGLESLQDQATQPSKAKILMNEVGTAPGLLFSQTSTTWIHLPGVPCEMKPMFEKEVLPFLSEKYPVKEKIFSYDIRYCLLKESSLSKHLHRVQKMYPSVIVASYPSLGSIRVCLSVRAPSSKEAWSLISGAHKEMSKVFPEYQYQAASLEEAVFNKLLEKGKTLAVAESCTGGGLSARVTALPGASKFFLGGVVAYANTSKEQFLGVSSHILESFGAVSEETVREMAKGALNRTGADFSLATSGVAGPGGGSQAKPLGTVCMAIGERGKEPLCMTSHFRGDRKTVIAHSITALLGHFYNRLENNKGY